MKTKNLLLIAAALFAALTTPAYCEWLTDYDKAVAESQAQNKPMLLDFTGSDWCEWCMKMDHETLDTGAFHDFADKNLILVKVDFPQARPQSDKVKEQNKMLAQKYKADGYPTYVLVGPKGKVRGTQVGYLAGGPKVFIALLTKWFPGMGSGTASSAAGGGATGGDDFDSFFKKPAGGSSPH